MKVFRFLLLSLVVVCAGCQSWCNPSPTTTPPLSIAPRQPQGGDAWCQYQITAQTPGCGNNRVGETICILCTERLAPNRLCPNPPGRLAVSPAQGCTFTLLPLAPGQQQCENCTARAGGTYQLSNQPGVP
jgi:hypothetical protein